VTYDQKLSERIRAELQGLPFVEKKMFGGVGYMLQGNMACGILGDDLIVRVSLEDYEPLLKRKHVKLFTMKSGPRPMKGWKSWIWLTLAVPPSTNLSRLASLRDLWTGVGLEDIESGDLLVQRTFDSFEEYWSIIQGGPSVGPGLAAMASETLGLLINRLRQILPIDHAGRITYSARAMAIKGRVPNQPGVPG